MRNSDPNSALDTASAFLMAALIILVLILVLLWTTEEGQAMVRAFL